MTRPSSPVFIIGAPRSGSTLLATMLNSHPRLFIANESKVFFHFLPLARRYDGRLSPARAGALVGELERSFLAQYAPLPPTADLLREVQAPTLAALLAAIFAELARREGKTRWGEKTAVGFRRLPLLQQAYPARFLAIERAPADVARSYQALYPKWGATGGFMHWMDFRRAVARPPSGTALLVIQYASLVTAPEPTLRSVCEHIGESFEPEMLAHHRTKRAKQLANNFEYGSVAQPIYTTPTRKATTSGPWFRWMLGLTRHRAAQIEAGRLGRPLWEHLLRTALFARASLWLVAHPHSLRLLLRRARRRLVTGMRKAGSAAGPSRIAVP